METENYPVQPCPKCGAPLEACGDVSIDGDAPQPVYECEASTCTRLFTFRAKTIGAPLTFAVAADGRVVEIPPGN
jgi:hypothetical protein